MDYYSMTDNSILAEIGNRLKALRLRKNITQAQLAKATTLNIKTIKALESDGSGKITSLVGVLRELDSLDALDSFIPEIQISPLQLAKQHGKVRQRASGKRLQKTSGEESEW